MRRLLVLAVACAAVGCGKRATPATTPTTPAPAAVSVGPPVTADEAEDFADELADAFNAGDTEAAVKLLRLDELVARSIDGLGLSAADRAGVRRGAVPAVRKVVEAVVGQVKDGGEYGLLRVRDAGGRPSAVFRVLGADGSLNYHEMPLVRFADGVGPADVFVTASGEPMSATFRRNMTRMATELNRGLLARLTGADRVYLDHLPALVAMQQQVLDGRHAPALVAYHGLPAELQKEKSVLLVALMAAGAADEAEYVRLVDVFRAAHPADPALDLLAIDYHFARKEYDRALAGLERLDKQVGGDPYLDVFRGNAHTRAGRPADGLAAAERLVAWRPGAVWGYQVGLTAAVATKDHPAVLAWFKRGAEAGAMEPDMAVVRTDDEYAAFRGSRQFAELEAWLEQRAKAGPKD